MHYEMRGFARYTVELLRAMHEIASGNLEIYSFSPGPIAPEFRAQLEITPVVFSARREILWEQVELPKRLRQAGIDVFHATGNRGLPYRRVCKYIVTCHDVIDRLPEFCVGEHWRGRWRKKYADFISRHRADRYVTVSEFSKQDICRLHGLAAKTVLVIHNAASQRFYESASVEQITRVRHKYGLPTAYLLFLGGFDRKKNVGALVEAFARLPVDSPSLVLAGERKWDFADVARKIGVLNLSARVSCPGKIDEEDLPALYQGALAFVHPSRYEGFGLQLVEAMASGLPIVASGTTCLPEILGGCGLLFDPEDPDCIARQMMRVIRDSPLRKTLAEKSRSRAANFSWHKAAERMLRLYVEVSGFKGDILPNCDNKSTTTCSSGCAELQP